MSKTPSFSIEKELRGRNIDFVFGMDEVGRGSFAGPLVASAVAFEKEFAWFKELNDSKLLTSKKREHLSKLILKNAKYFTEIIDVATINKIGIGRSNKLIFERLIKKILRKHKGREIHFLIDGNKKEIKIKNLQFFVRGDSRIISIAAASIIAKVHRDNLMRKYHKLYPQYNFLNNKGYGTKTHRDAIKQNGLIKIHRTSFNI